MREEATKKITSCAALELLRSDTRETTAPGLEIHRLVKTRSLYTMTCIPAELHSVDKTGIISARVWHAA